MSDDPTEEMIRAAMDIYYDSPSLDFKETVADMYRAMIKLKPLATILIFLMTLYVQHPVHAASADLPIRANVVQCGKRADLQQACERDQRCCALIRPMVVAGRTQGRSVLKSR